MLGYTARQALVRDIIHMQETNQDIQPILDILIPILSETERQKLTETKRISFLTILYLSNDTYSKLNTVVERLKSNIPLQTIFDYLKHHHISLVLFAKLVESDVQSLKRMRKNNGSLIAPSSFFSAFQEIQSNKELYDELIYISSHKGYHTVKLEEIIKKYKKSNETQEEEENPYSLKRKCTSKPIVYSQRLIDRKMDKDCGPLTSDTIVNMIEKNNIQSLSSEQLHLLKNDDEMQTKKKAKITVEIPSTLFEKSNVLTDEQRQCIISFFSNYETTIPPSDAVDGILDIIMHDETVNNIRKQVLFHMDFNTGTWKKYGRHKAIKKEEEILPRVLAVKQEEEKSHHHHYDTIKKTFSILHSEQKGQETYQREHNNQSVTFSSNIIKHITGVLTIPPVTKACNFILRCYQTIDTENEDVLREFVKNIEEHVMLLIVLFCINRFGIVSKLIKYYPLLIMTDELEKLYRIEPSIFNNVDTFSSYLDNTPKRKRLTELETIIIPKNNQLLASIKSQLKVVETKHNDFLNEVNQLKQEISFS